MNYSQLLEEVKINVTSIFLAGDCKKIPYHNLSHTEQVVANAVRIANHYKLNDTDFFIVVAASWFHDSGYCNGMVKTHEENGAMMAGAFLAGNGVENDIITEIHKCIMATTLPQKPSTLLEQIICDADLYHFGTDSFASWNKLMRKEVEWRTGKAVSKDDWRKETIALMESHHFHTDYCKELLQDTKNKNLEALNQKDEKTNNLKSVKIIEAGDSNTTKTVSPATVVNKPKDDRLNRGIETMFRITSGNNQRLSDMADKKANIMISTTSIIISVLLSVLFRKLEENPQLAFPAILLLTVCVGTMVLAILATRPTLPNGRFTEEDIKEKKANPLFFGNFYRMTFDEYNSGMQQVISDREYLYSSLTRDIYSQGVVLGRKYRLLRLAYNVFMYGIVTSVAAFIIASLFF